MPSDASALWMRRLPYAVAAAFVVLLAAILLPAIQQAREAARQSQSKNNLMQLGLALHNYHDTFGGLPPGGTFHLDGRPHHGWMTSILPYMDASPIYTWIDFNQPWDSALNAGIFTEPHAGYQNPRVPMTVGSWEYYPAHYSANSHLLGPNSFVKFEEISARSSMMLAGELRSEFVPWGCPFNYRPLESANNQDAYGTPARPGWIILLADGSVRILSDGIEPELLRSLGGANLATTDNAPNIQRPDHFNVPADALKRHFYSIGNGTLRLDFIDKDGRVVRSQDTERK